MASEDFHITLIGAAKGLEQKYIDAWKYRFIACENNDPSVNEEKLNQSVKKIAGLLGYTLPETVLNLMTIRKLFLMLKKHQKITNKKSMMKIKMINKMKINKKL